MRQQTWICAILLGMSTLAIAGCGGGNNNVTPASEVYVRGSYSGTLVDVANVFGQGAGASATITYNDNPQDTTGVANGQLVFPNKVTIPVIVTTYPQSVQIAVNIALPSNPAEYLISCYYNGVTNGMVLTSTNTYGGDVFEYSFTTGTGVIAGTGTMSVTYQTPAASIKGR